MFWIAFLKGFIVIPMIAGTFALWMWLISNGTWSVPQPFEGVTAGILSWFAILIIVGCFAMYSTSR